MCIPLVDQHVCNLDSGSYIGLKVELSISRPAQEGLDEFQLVFEEFKNAFEQTCGETFAPWRELTRNVNASIGNRLVTCIF